MVSWAWSGSIMLAACCVQMECGSPDKDSPSSVFCFSVVMPFGYEPELLAAQVQGSQGLFGCDAFQIFSNASFDASGSLSFRGAMNITDLEGPLDSPLGARYNSYLNAPTLAKAWEHIFSEGKYKLYDWVIKLDTDAVAFPGRSRQITSSSCREDPCEPLALKTCTPDSMVPGPMQAFSRAAVEQMALSGFAICREQLDLEKLEEDVFMSQCLDLLHIERRYNSRALQNMDCGYEDWEQGLLMATHLHKFLVCDCCHAVFHPFKSPEDWQSCRYWAHNAKLSGRVRLYGSITLVCAFIGIVCFARARLNKRSLIRARSYLRSLDCEPEPDVMENITIEHANGIAVE